MLAPQTLVLRDGDVAEDVALARKPQARIEMVGRKAATPELCWSRGRDWTFDADRTRPAGAATATVNRTRHLRIQRKARAQKDGTQVRSLRTFDRPARESDDGHGTSSGCRTELAPGCEPRRAQERRRAPGLVPEDITDGLKSS